MCLIPVTVYICQADELKAFKGQSLCHTHTLQTEPPVFRSCNVSSPGAKMQQNRTSRPLLSNNKNDYCLPVSLEDHKMAFLTYLKAVLARREKKLLFNSRKEYVHAPERSVTLPFILSITCQEHIVRIEVSSHIIVSNSKRQ